MKRVEGESDTIMLNRIRFSGLSLLALALLVPPLHAQLLESSLIDPNVAARFGLQRSWFTQISLDPSRSHIDQLRVHVSSTRAQTVFEVVTQRGTEFMSSERHLGLWGEPIGPAGARKVAEQRLLEIKTGGGDGKIVEKLIPEVMVVVTTNSGLVHALDGETGKSLWATRVGSRKYPTSEPAISDKYVSVINGTALFVLDALDGAIIWQSRVEGVPATGPALVGDWVFAPKLNGNLEAYSLAPNAKSWPDRYRAGGTITVQPKALGNRLITGTATGFISVLTAGKGGIRYRIDTDSPIVGRITTALPTQVLAVTATGRVYSFDIRDGRMLWRFATGKESREPATVIGDSVFVLSQREGLFCLETATGLPRWTAANARRFVAATNDQVFLETQVGSIEVLDIATGNFLGAIPTRLTDQIFSNSTTDRIYVATSRGVVQCLHTLGARWPTVHLGDTKIPTKSATAPAGPAATEPAGMAPAQPANPFGPSAAPGAGGGAAAPDANPFGPPPATKGAPKKDPGSADGNPFG